MNAQPLLATWTLTFHLGKHHEAVKTAVETVSQTHTSMFATLAALFAVGAVGFYLYLLLLSVVFTISVENDNGLAYFWSGIVAVIGIALYHAQLLALLTNWHRSLLHCLRHRRGRELCSTMVQILPQVCRGKPLPQA